MAVKDIIVSEKICNKRYWKKLNKKNRKIGEIPAAIFTLAIITDYPFCYDAVLSCGIGVCNFISWRLNQIVVARLVLAKVLAYRSHPRVSQNNSRSSRG